VNHKNQTSERIPTEKNSPTASADHKPIKIHSKDQNSSQTKINKVVNGKLNLRAGILKAIPGMKKNQNTNPILIRPIQV
jgi:hypothetical protein